MATGAELLYVGLHLFVAACLAVLALMVHKTAQGRIHNRLFAALFAVSAVKSLADGVRPLAPGFHAAAPAFPGLAFWFHLSVTCLVVMVPLLLLFVSSFPRPWMVLVRRPRLAVLYAAPSVVFLALYFLPHGLPVARVHLLVGLNAASTLAILVVVGVLLGQRARTRDPIERVRTQYLLGVFTAYALGTVVVVAPLLVRGAGTAFGLAASVTALLPPVLELAAASVIAYAILKYQLLGVELKVKHGARYVIATGSLFLLLFLTNVLVEEYVIEPFFNFTNLAFLFAAAVGSVLFKPIERASQYVTNRLFPDTTKDPTAYLRERAREIYHAQVWYVLRDQTVHPRERSFLDNLRQQLSLTIEEAAGVERNAQRARGLGLADPAAPVDVSAAPRA